MRWASGNTQAPVFAIRSRNRLRSAQHAMTPAADNCGLTSSLKNSVDATDDSLWQKAHLRVPLKSSVGSRRPKQLKERSTRRHSAVLGFPVSEHIVRFELEKRKRAYMTRCGEM